MFDENDFFLNDDELGNDCQLTLTEEAELKTLNTIQDITKELKENLLYNERKDAEKNINLLAIHMDNLIKLSQINNELSESELKEAIDEVFKSTTKITFENIDKILPKEIEEEDESDNNFDSNNSASTDW